MGGRDAWEGAILLQSLHQALVAWISEEIPGQKMEDSALAVITDVPWWAACSADKHLDLREGEPLCGPCKG